MLAERGGLQPHVVWAALGVTIERGEEHDALWGHLGIEKPTGGGRDPVLLDDLYPDASSASSGCASSGFGVGIVGNQTEALEAGRASRRCRPTSSRRRRASASASRPAFFDEVASSMGPATTRSRTSATASTTTSLPAAAAGMVAVHVRRGPWGRLQRTPPEARSALDDLA